MTEKCPRCNGTGKLNYGWLNNHYEKVEHTTHCRECAGTGTLDAFEAELDELFGPAETITLTEKFK